LEVISRINVSLPSPVIVDFRGIVWEDSVYFMLAVSIQALTDSKPPGCFSFQQSQTKVSIIVSKTIPISLDFESKNGDDSTSARAIIGLSGLPPILIFPRDFPSGP